jgi:hypothetical protein
MKALSNNEKLLCPTIKVTEKSSAKGSRAEILVAICSCQKYSGKRKVIGDTWLSECVDNVTPVFFVGGEQECWTDPQTVMVEAPDDYAHLPLKIRKFFEFSLRNFDFDWIFKCDDDTYVALDRLHSLLSPDHDIIGSPYLEERGSPSGGAGYFLSRAMVEELLADASLPCVGDEDVIHGEAVIRYGAKPLSTPRLKMDASNFPRPDNDIVTAHWCSAERLEIIHSIHRESILEEVPVKHPFWSDEIILYKGEAFMRASTCCHGKWHRLKNGSLILDWLDWPAEIFAPAVTSGNKSTDVESKITPLVFQCEMTGVPPGKKAGTAKEQIRIWAEEDWSGERRWRQVALPTAKGSPLPVWKKNSVFCISLAGAIDTLDLVALRDLITACYGALKPGSFMRVEFLDLTRAFNLVPSDFKIEPTSTEIEAGGRPQRRGSPAVWVEAQVAALLRVAGFLVQPTGIGWSAFGDINGRTNWIEKEWSEDVLPQVCCLEAIKFS